MFHAPLALRFSTFVRVPVALLAVGALLAGANSAAAQITADFESSPLGSLPAGWLDVAAVDPGCSPSSQLFPSASVVLTSDAQGLPTKALATADGTACTQGIYKYVAPSQYYRVAADVRIDRYSDFNQPVPESDWPMAVGMNKFENGDFSNSHTVQIYVSTFTRGWRMIAYGANALKDVDLGLPAQIGTWYRAQVELAAASGTVQSRIWNASTGQLLVNRVDQIPGWVPADGAFDTLALFDHDGFAPSVANLAVVDKVVFTTCPQGLPFESDVPSLSLAAGGEQCLCLDAGAVNAYRPYFVLGTASGTAPGLTVDGLFVPLNPDGYTLFTLQYPNSGLLAHSLGALNELGLASATFHLPPLSDPALAGVQLHHLYVLLGGALDYVSNPEPLLLLP